MLGAALAQQAAADFAARSRGNDEEQEIEQPRGLLRGLFLQLDEEPPSIQSRMAGILSADRRESSIDEADER